VNVIVFGLLSLLGVPLFSGISQPPNRKRYWTHQSAAQQPNPMPLLILWGFMF